MTDRGHHRLEVFYEAFQVGTVETDAQGAVSFHYAPRWQATPGAFPISTALPLAQSIHHGRAVAAWLANLLPEEAPLSQLARGLGIDGTDTVALLDAVGGDTAGALSFGRPSRRADWTYRHLDDLAATDGTSHDQEGALAAHLEQLAERPFLDDGDGVRLSLAGGQQKSALAVLDSAGRVKTGLPEPGDRLALPENGAASTAIAKPDNPNLPGIVENEAFCLALARDIGLATAEATILPARGRNVLVVARYDRRLRPDGSIRRLHQEDAAQAGAFLPRQKYERATGGGARLEDIFALAAHLGPRDALALTDQVLFSLLVANTDAHAKNFSILLNEGAQIAPIYDVSCVLPWAGRVNQHAAQTIGGKKRKPADLAPRHWEAIALAGGLNPRSVRLRAAELADAIFRKCHDTEATVSAYPGAVPRIVADVRGHVEANVLRILGRMPHRT